MTDAHKSCIPSGLFPVRAALTALLMLWASPPTPGWAYSPAWADLSGPKAGPAQAVAVDPDYPER